MNNFETNQDCGYPESSGDAELSSPAEVRRLKLPRTTISSFDLSAPFGLKFLIPMYPGEDDSPLYGVAPTPDDDSWYDYKKEYIKRTRTVQPDDTQRHS